MRKDARQPAKESCKKWRRINEKKAALKGFTAPFHLVVVLSATLGYVACSGRYVDIGPLG
jgi:hypothetical protein